MLIRLDKYLADSGEGTRTTVKQLIKKGRVRVNGNSSVKPEMKINTDTDEVSVDERNLTYHEYEYFMLHKPAGVISASEDKTKKTVVDLIDGQKRRDLFPVGRLDKDTEGLLIITNDGPLCNRLLAPGKHVEKKYYAKVRGKVTEEDVRLFQTGVDIGDDKLTKEAKLSVSRIYEENDETYSDIYLIITEGRYHQVKRMFEAVGKEVVYLKRLSMGPIELDETLAPGAYRKLTEEELSLIMK